jgi:hypothetical protein
MSDIHNETPNQGQQNASVDGDAVRGDKFTGNKVKIHHEGDVFTGDKVGSIQHGVKSWLIALVVILLGAVVWLAFAFADNRAGEADKRAGESHAIAERVMDKSFDFAARFSSRETPSRKISEDSPEYQLEKTRMNIRAIRSGLIALRSNYLATGKKMENKPGEILHKAGPNLDDSAKYSMAATMMMERSSKDFASKLETFIAALDFAEQHSEKFITIIDGEGNPVPDVPANGIIVSEPKGTR